MRGKVLQLFVLCLITGCGFTTVKDEKQEAKMSGRLFTEKEILKDLDDCGPQNFFIDLDHPYIYTIGSRINLYANDTNWAIVFEKYEYRNRDYVVEIQLNYFGNCVMNCNDPITGEPSNTKEVCLISKAAFENVESSLGEVNKESAQYIQVRGLKVAVENDIKEYWSKGVISEGQDLIESKDFARLLFEEKPDLFYATDVELGQCLPVALPKILTIDHFHYKHYDFYSMPHRGDKPSTYETFQLIAKILVSKDTSLWRPKLQPNNDWRNYPNSGNL